MRGCIRITLGSALLLTAGLIATSAQALEDNFPSKPIHIIVPFPAGAGGDVRTRQLAPFISQRLNQPVIIENRPGAAGNIGTAALAKSPPDGYTLAYILLNTMAVNPHLYRDSGFDPIKDLTPVILTLRTALILVVNPDSPIRSMKDLFAQAKAKPGKLTYGMSGLGSIQHLFGEYLKKETNIDLVPIPYKGDAPTLTDLMGGQIDLAFGSPQITVPLINSGKLRAIAVTSAKRLGNLPDVPTIAESGVPGYDESVWTGFAVPSGTPAGIVKKLHESIRGAILSTEFKRAAEETGAELIASTQEYAVQFVRTEFERYRQIVKDLNLKVE